MCRGMPKPPKTQKTRRFLPTPPDTQKDADKLQAEIEAKQKLPTPKAGTKQKPPKIDPEPDGQTAVPVPPISPYPPDPEAGEDD